jgi:hypothetical protein
VFGAKPDLGSLRVYGSPACDVIPHQKVGGKLDDRAEKGRYMGVRLAGVWFLHDGGRIISERRDVKVVEQY